MQACITFKTTYFDSIFVCTQTHKKKIQNKNYFTSHTNRCASRSKRPISTIKRGGRANALRILGGFRIQRSLHA